MLQMSSSSDYERHKNNNNTTANGGGGGRSSRNKKKGAPFMFFTNILKKKKILNLDEIREMNQRTRSEPSGELFGGRMCGIYVENTNYEVGLVWGLCHVVKDFFMFFFVFFDQNNFKDFLQ